MRKKEVKLNVMLKLNESYVNVFRMHVRLNGKPLDEVDCFLYLESPVATDGGCERYVIHRMNEGYKACNGGTSARSSGFGINAKKYP